VPGLACAALLLPGCYLLHQNGEEPCGPPTGQVCCDADGYPARVGPGACPLSCPAGTRLRAEASCTPSDGGTAPPPPPPVPADAGTPADAGPLMCPEVRADATCLESFLVQPGVPFELPVTFDTCACCAATECRAEVTEVLGTPTLRLTTTMCPDPCDCETCVTPRASCAVPALEAGLWDVVVNDAPAFRLPVFPDSGFVPPPPACVSYAEPDVCRLSESVPEVSGYRPGEVCVRERGGAALPTTVTVAHHCWGCGDLQGPCSVTLEPRLPADLPPGGEIRLGPTHFATACDVDCPDVCIRAEQSCIVPDLEPGGFYRVWADGEVVLSFTADGAAFACSGRG